MSKITMEQFARLWGHLARLPRKQLLTLNGLIEEQLEHPESSGVYTVNKGGRGRPRKAAEPPAGTA